MRRGLLAPIGLFAVVCLPALSVRAEPFKCPHVGGNFVFGQEANINTLDQMTSSTISTRNIAMNIYKSLMTRDENNHPILELAEAMNEAPDHLTYTFKLRQGMQFHNGKPMTSADVVGVVRPLCQGRQPAQHTGQCRSLGCAGCRRHS